MRATRGRAVAERDTLVVAANDPSNTVILTVITTPFRSASYPVIAWSGIDIPEHAEVRLLWRNDYAPDKFNAAPITVASGRLLPVSLAQEPDWIGNITGIAIAIKGTFLEPARIGAVSAEPMGAIELLRDRLGEWFTFEKWTGISINTVTGGSDIQDLPLLPLLALAVAAATAVWGSIAYRRGELVYLPAVMGVLFVAAWLLSDVRWSWNLVRQVKATVAQYAGKNAIEKHLAADDGPLFAFIQHVRAKLPAKQVRVFMAADAHYFRGRGAYHLYPYNVYFEPYANTVPSPAQLHTGDFLVVYQRKGIQYDRADQQLRWDGNQPVHAELVLLEPGAALFRIL